MIPLAAAILLAVHQQLLLLLYFFFLRRIPNTMPDEDDGKVAAHSHQESLAAISERNDFMD